MHVSCLPEAPFDNCKGQKAYHTRVRKTLQSTIYHRQPVPTSVSSAAVKKRSIRLDNLT